MTLDIGILTRQRLHTLRQAINSILATAGSPVALTIAFDDDVVGYQSLPPYPELVKYLLTPRHYYVRGTNELYALLGERAKKEGRTLSHFLILNDDVEFYYAGWAEALVAAYDRLLPEGGIMELEAHGKAANFMTCPSFVDGPLGGYLADPRYTMYCSDTDLLQRASAVNGYRAVALGEGQQPCLQHLAVRDSLREEVSYWYARDLRLYNERAARRGWPTERK